MANLVLKDYEGHPLPTYTGVQRVGIPNAETGALNIFVDSSDANATAEEIAMNRTAYVQGAKVVGTGKLGGKGTAYISIIGNSLKLQAANLTKTWDGELEYSIDGTNWIEWEGETIRSASAIYLRGSENTYISGAGNNGFDLSAASNIYILGNIENLLDYDETSSNLHPQMASYAFANLFSNCAQLTVAPELKGNELSTYCYYNMFAGCTSLISAPSLPAITLVAHCYEGMFANCSSLMTAPDLPALTLADSCYREMFSSCTSIETIPNLTAPILTPYCYYMMYANCIQLQRPCNIIGTSFAPHCCESMFTGCKGLAFSTTQTGLYTNSYIVPASGLGSDSTNALTNMFANTSGTFTGTPTINVTYYWYCIYTEANLGCVEVYSRDNTNVTLSMGTNAGIKTWNGVIEYDTDDTYGWIVWDGSPITATNIKLRGINNSHLTTSNNSKGFIITGTQVVFKGYIESLLDYKRVINNLTITLDSYCFNRLFFDCDSLVSPLMFYSSTISEYGCYYMYSSCSGLTTMPKLPATNLGAHCYSYMFSYCNHLDIVTAVLPATTLFDYCYSSMFLGCTSLTTMPELPAMNLSSYCYNYMFSGCSSLSTLTSLPATVVPLNGYQYMFNNCTSLTTMPELPAMTLNDYCYDHMFSGCSALVNVSTLPALTVSSYSYQYMFYKCTSLTTMPQIEAVTLGSYSCAYMFQQCTALTTLTSFNAISFSSYCYSHMFDTCTALEQIPELLVKAPVSYAFQYMFSGCSKIKFSTSFNATDYPTPYRIPSFGAVSSSGSLSYMFSGTKGTFTGSPTLTTTYYTPNTIVPSLAYTRIGVHITSQTTVPLYFTLSTYRMIIDWGDGSVVSISGGANIATHTYTTTGDFIIRMWSQSGQWILGKKTNNTTQYSLFGQLDVQSTAYNKSLMIPYVTSIQLGRDCLFRTSSGGVCSYATLGGLPNLSGTVTIPGNMKYIPSLLFSNCTNLTRIILNKGIIEIEAGAFAYCSSLEEIEFPSTLEKINNNYTYNSNSDSKDWYRNFASLFISCNNLQRITIPAGLNLTVYNTLTFSSLYNLTTVLIKSPIPFASSMFAYCRSLSHIEFLTESIGSSAFSGCLALTSIHIPSMTTSIGENVFDNCPLLSTITVDPANNYYITENNILYNKNKTQILRYPAPTSSESFVIPSTVTQISGGAFYGCSSLTSISIPNSVTSIGTSAFRECSSLISISIPNSVTSIANYLFENCTSLTNIEIPNSVTSIGAYAFYRCRSLTSISIPNSVTSIGTYAFYATGITSILISANVTSIGNYAFASCSALENITVASNNSNYSSISGILYDKNQTTLIQCPGQITELILPNTVTTLSSAEAIKFLISITISDVLSASGFSLLHGDALTTINTNSTNLNYIGINGVLYDISQTTLIKYPNHRAWSTLINTIVTIGDYAFSFCTLPLIDIPNGVTTINQYAFASVTTTQIILPETVVSIGDDAFSSPTGSSLTSLTCLAATPPTLTSTSIAGLSSTCAIYVPAESVTTYQEAEYWSIRSAQIQAIVE